MKEKKWIHNSSKEYPEHLLIIFTLKYLPQSYYIALLKSGRFTLRRKSFLIDLLRQGKEENKKEKVWLL